MEKIAGSLLALVIGVLMVYGGLKALYTKKIRVSWTESGDDIKERNGVLAILWGLFFLGCGIYVIYSSVLHLNNIL